MFRFGGSSRKRLQSSELMIIVY